MSQVELPRGVEVLMPSPVAMACCPTLPILDPGDDKGEGARVGAKGEAMTPKKAPKRTAQAQRVQPAISYGPQKRGKWARSFREREGG